MIDLIISATVGAIAGSAIMRRIDLRKMAELRSLSRRPLIDASAAIEQSAELTSAHARLADACLAKQAPIGRGLEWETPGAHATVKRMARILRGDA